MSATTKHVLDTRLFDVINAEAMDSAVEDPHLLSSMVNEYAEALSTAPRFSIAAHLLGLVWGALRGSAGAKV